MNIAKGKKAPSSSFFFFFFFSYWQQRHAAKVEVLQQRIWFHQTPSVMCYSFSSTFYPLEMWLLHCMLLFNLLPHPRPPPPPSLACFLSLSRSRYPCSPSVLLCEVTCESDQLNPDHQLCLTYFRFGTLGFTLFHFCLCGISMNAQHTHAVWPAAFGS